MTIKRISLAVLAAGALAGSCVAVAVGDDSASSSETAAAAAPKIDPATAFGVFRRPAQSADAMPDSEQRILAGVARRENVSLANARAVAPSAGRLVWAIPGPDKVCLAIPDPIDGYGFHCADASSAANGGLWTGIAGLLGQRVGDGRVAIFVPDGVDAVTAVGTAGGRATLQVSDNVAFGDVSDAGRLEFSSDGVIHTAPIAGTTEEMVRAQEAAQAGR